MEQESNKMSLISNTRLINKNISLDKLSIAKSFIIFASVITVLTTILYFYFSWKIYSDNIKSTLQEQSSRIETSFTDTIDYTAYLMRYLNLRIKNNPKDLGYISNLLSSFHLDSEVNNKIPWNMFSWVNDGLFLVVNSNLGVVKPIDVSDREYILKSKENQDKIYLNKPSYGKVSGEMIIPVGMGIKDNKGKYLGSMVFGINIAKLIEKIHLSVSNDEVAFAIYSSEDLSLILHSKNYAIDKEQDELIKKIDLSLPQGEIKHYTTYSHYHKIDKYPYFVVTQYSNKFFTTKLFFDLLPRLFEITAILVILFAILFILKTIIITPILRLSEAAKAISQDKNELASLLLPETNIAEINELSKQLKAIQEYKINLLHAKKSQNNFFSNMSHELRTPLTGVMSYAELMKEEIHGPLNDDYKKLSNVIFKSGQHLLSLINELLNFSKLNSDKVEISNDKLDIAFEINNAIDVITAEAKKEEITIHTNFSHYNYLLKADKSMLQRILLNILSNAIKFSHHGEKIMVNTQISNFGELQISVIDHGIGIKQEDIPLIMEEYGQAKNSRTVNPNQGFGLGLPIVQKMIALHQGSLKIDSVFEKGTVATITFPNERLIRAE